MKIVTALLLSCFVMTVIALPSFAAMDGQYEYHSCTFDIDNDWKIFQQDDNIGFQDIHSPNCLIVVGYQEYTNSTIFNPQFYENLMDSFQSLLNTPNGRITRDETFQTSSDIWTRRVELTKDDEKGIVESQYSFFELADGYIVVILSMPFNDYNKELDDAYEELVMSFTPELSSPDLILLVQQALNNAGFDCGEPDGEVGTMTRNAIDNYRSENGLKDSDKINDDLIISLGLSQEVHNLFTH